MDDTQRYAVAEDLIKNAMDVIGLPVVCLPIDGGWKLRWKYNGHNFSYDVSEVRYHMYGHQEFMQKFIKDLKDQYTADDYVAKAKKIPLTAMQKKSQWKQKSSGAVNYGGGGVTGELAKVFKNIHTQVKHPVTRKDAGISSIIVNLNDQYKWTRERIADWLETLDVDLTLVD